MKRLGEYHDLYLKSDTFYLTEFLEKLQRNVFKNLSIRSCKGQFVLAPGLAWRADFKKAEVKLELLTDIDMLLMVEKEFQEEYVIQFINM